MKHKISADSELKDANIKLDCDEYPKTVMIVLDRSPNDPDRIVVHREVSNLSAFELYGLLTAVLESVKDQMAFPESQRSDGIVVTKNKKAKTNRY